MCGNAKAGQIPCGNAKRIRAKTPRHVSCNLSMDSVAGSNLDTGATMTRDTGATVDDLDSSNLDKHVQHDFEINRSMKRVAKARFGPGHDVGGRRVAWPHLDTVWCDETGDGAYGPNGELVWTDGLQAVRRKPYSDTLLRDLMQASVSLPVPGLIRMR